VRRLDPDLATVLAVLEHSLGPLQVLAVGPNAPRRRPALPLALGPTGPGQPSLFDPNPKPATSTTAPTPPLTSRRTHELV